MKDTQLRALAASKCEVRTDPLTRQLYATDASLYQIVPAAVAFPHSAEETSAIMLAAADAGLSVSPRGAGTGLAGGALGDGVVVDLAHYRRRISDLDLEQGTVRVDPGVVLDQLNAFLKPHGKCFGPDVATSSRATLGGMIANNSSGARAPYYGTTAEHLVSADVVLANGRIKTAGAGARSLQAERAEVDRLLAAHAGEIRRRFHSDIVKRWPGYGLDRALRAPGDLSQIVAGSEGTLAAVTSAVLKVSPLPKEKGLGLAFFHSVDAAMQAAEALAELHPVAIEHIDRPLFDQTKGHHAFGAARAFLRLDEEPCEGILIVEFYDEVRARLDAFSRLDIGCRRLVCSDAKEMDLVWGLRKAGLSLLTSRKGPAKPVPGLEDVCVPPSVLAAYIARIEEAARPLGLEVSFYGHVASGLVHIRPVIDLHRAEDIAKYRAIADKSCELALEFRGSMSAEHGVGIGHAEFMEAQVGAELFAVMRAIKQLFDPRGLMNPGKIIPDGRYSLDTNLRQGAGHAIALPFTPVLAYAARDESLVAHLEQCNGCGECRKDPPTMCPTFQATGEEFMVTRGRANAIRAALERRLEPSDSVLAFEELGEALDYCLSCKACQAECPSNVDMALLKAELAHARHRFEGLPPHARLFSRVDLVNEWGSRAPALANALLQTSWFRKLLERCFGIAARRPLPAFAKQRFDRWFARHPQPPASPRGTVLLWDDCFVRHNEPQIGIAAVKVLEAAGYRVALPEGRACCGRPAFSMGRLDVAARFGKWNVALLSERWADAPVLFLESSCYSMFAQDYHELGIAGARGVAERCTLFEPFLFDLLEREPGALSFARGPAKTAIHNHCHAKLFMAASIPARLAARIPGNDARPLDSGCCGMAGAFGAMASKYELSLNVAAPLVQMVRSLEPGTRLVASGTSCRHQIVHLTDAKPLHMAELLAGALRE